jgi:hypothetical protein
MFFAVTLEIEPRGMAEQKIDFWRRFAAADRGLLEEVPEEDTVRLEDSKAKANAYELLFRKSFPQILEALVNEEIRRTWDRVGGRKKKIPEINMRLITVEYSSIKAILDVVGLDNNDIRDFVLTTMEIYSPLAFRQALNTVITVSASVKAVGNAWTANWPSNESAPPVAERGIEALGRAWIISNTSLLVPVGLALLICYFVFSALTHQLQAVRSETAAVQAERTELIKALVAQNAKISDWLIGYSKSSDSHSGTSGR